MKFINQYTNKVYDTIEACEASEKEYLEKVRDDMRILAKSILNCNGQKEAKEVFIKLPDSKKDPVIAELKNMYPYSAVDTILSYQEFENGEDEMIRAVKYLWSYAKYPYIEQLLKAGVLRRLISDSTIGRSYSWYNKYEDLDKHFKKGKTLVDITGLKMFMIPFIEDVKTWGEYDETSRIFRKVAKGKEDCQLWKDLLNQLNITRMREVKYLLNNGYFTLQTLHNYLDRLDQHQAIGKYEAIVLTKRYVSNCKKLDINPVFDSPSIKRDVDVTNREVRRIADALFEREIKVIFESPEYKKLAYENDEFVVITPTCNHDLIVEGQNLHNCVGSYGRWYIKNGNGKVVFVRRKSDPSRSYVCVDISKRVDGYHIRQFLTFSNQQPDVKALAFKDEYQRYLSTLK